MSVSPMNTSTIASIQLTPAGLPRFVVPSTDDESWEWAAERESAGGIDAEIRAFLDAQLETGDVVVDLDPGFGFVALSATTAPSGMPTVFIAGLSSDRTQQLQDAAADAGGWIESLGAAELDALSTQVDSRLEPRGRVFVHVRAENVAWACSALMPLFGAERVLAICVSDAASSERWADARAMLALNQFTPCGMREQQGEAIVLPFRGAPDGPVIALPTSVAGDVPTSDELTAHVDVDDSIFGAINVVDKPAASPTTVAASSPIALRDSSRWSAMRDGFSFIAPHSRTGYGMAAAHLLRALQAKQIPIAFFPIGPLDRGLIDNDTLSHGLQLQGAYRPDVPSVRMSQQFDLALHVGRGTRIAYTVFERDEFTASERHHLEQQDALLVCSEWARQVCLDNGITDKPIHVVPHGVDREVFHEGVIATMDSTETMFLQVGKLESRKGQLELLRAFEAAFTPRDAVRLVLSCHNPFVSVSAMALMLAPFTSSPLASRITIMDRELPALSDVAALMAGADCGVFPSRSEGWNLEALEMLSMGKSVVATSCTGHTEYLTRDNARLIKIDAFEPAISNGVPLTGQWAAWGNSQHEQLIAHLRAIHAAKQTAGFMPRNDAGIRTALHYSWSYAADCLVRGLDAIA